MDTNAEKTVVVTGGATGVGAAVVEQLVAQGCQVHALDVAPIESTGNVNAVACDLAEPDSISEAASQMPDRIDALVNVAGVAGPQPGDWVVKVNFLGMRQLTEQLHGRIDEGGSIVNVSSTAGRLWERRREVVDGLLDTDGFEAGAEWLIDNESRWAKDPYTFSKQCVTAWTLRMAQHGAKGQVRVNSVSPGGIDTQLTASFREQMGQEFSDWRMSFIGRSAVPAEIAEPIVWLALGPCGWVNGADLIVDRGLEAGDKSGWVDLTQAPRR